MKISTTVSLKLLLLSVISISMVACNQGPSNSTDLSSRIVDTNNSTKAVAFCNEGSNSKITLNLKAAMSSTGTAYRMDRVFMKLSKLPNGFVEGTDYFNFWSWMVNPNSSPYIDPTPLNFYLYDTQTNQAVTNVRNSLKWSDISATASTWGLDATAFFQRVILVIDIRGLDGKPDVNGEFDVIKTALYSLSSNEVVESLDTLLPLFYASPSDYKYESNGANRSTILTNLHPFKSMINQGGSSSQFASDAKAFCF